MNRLVLLSVDPYLLHAYWELPAGPPPSTGAQPVLRLHESPLTSTTSRPIDIDVDLAAGSTQLHLWTSARRYFAELGLRRADGELLLLARSNTLQTAAIRPSDPPAPPAPSATSPDPIVHTILPVRPRLAEPVPHLDLTQYTEDRFLPGLPSSPGGPNRA